MQNDNSNYPLRPGRLQILFDNQTPLFFVTFNTYKRIRVLANNAIHKAFTDFCKKSPDHGIAVGNYVKMPDHIHLFVWLNHDNIGLSRFVKSLKEKLGKTILRQRINKPHWQQGFFDHVLRSSENYQEKSLYVRMNPVRVGLCVIPEDWAYGGKIHDLTWYDM